MGACPRFRALGERRLSEEPQPPAAAAHLLAHVHAVDGDCLRDVLECLHSVYEDLFLDTLRWREMPPLAGALYSLASALGEEDFCAHYVRDFPSCASARLPPQGPPARPLREAPSLLRWLMACARSAPPPPQQRGEPLLPLLQRQQGAGAHACVRRSCTVLEIYSNLFCGNDAVGSGGKQETALAARRCVEAMARLQFGLPELDRLPPAISLPIRAALQQCREDPPTGWPAAAYLLVGREDMAASSRGGELPLADPAELRQSMAAPYLHHLRSIPDQTPVDASIANQKDKAQDDGMEHMYEGSLAAERFKRDLRLSEVRRLLGSARPVALSSDSSTEASDPDALVQQQLQLRQVAHRTTALPFGRAAFTLATARPLPTEALPIPKLVLAGRLPSQQDATVSLDMSSEAGALDWPNFHNGVAAGLKLAPGQAALTRTWIVYNKPKEPSYAHAGLLMALGLQGHLSVLAATDVYRYLSQEHDATTAGVLLGMAAAHRGSMDASVSKMLYLHLPSRHPPSFPDLELPTIVQAAALVAVGLLYQGTAHRLTTEILLGEMEWPGGEAPIDRQCYAVSAGLALGLVTLGKGGEAWGLKDLHIEGRLHYFFSGASDLSQVRRNEGRNRAFAPGSSSVLLHPTRHIDDSQGSQMLEGPMVNLDVTAPGATLALALMYLKTNDASVAARLAIPDTHFALEQVRPDFILLRVVARALILWDSVEASDKWVQAQVPDVLKAAARAGESAFAGGAVPAAYMDLEAIAQGYYNVLAGACLAIGLRYAGTASTEAQQLLHSHVLLFLREKRSIGGMRKSFVDKGTLETCLCTAVLALGAVMAGTGHLETLKLLRFLRRRIDPEGQVTFGSHMAVSTALGFLFMGGGTHTFSTSNSAVAALLIAMYPRFPVGIGDHRCHLQALRHLWVLAAEPCGVAAMDVDSGQPVRAPLEVTLHDAVRRAGGASARASSFCTLTPCLLPSTPQLKRLQVCGPKYWPQAIEVPNHTDASRVIMVKRRLECHLHSDPHNSKAAGGAGERLPSSGAGEGSLLPADPSLGAFAKLLGTARRSLPPGDCRNACLAFFSRALEACVKSNQPAMLQVWAALYSASDSISDLQSGDGGWASSSQFIPRALADIQVAILVGRREKGCSSAEDKMGSFVAEVGERMDSLFDKYSTKLAEELAASSNPALPPLHAFSHRLSHGEHSILHAAFLHCWGLPGPAATDFLLNEMASLRAAADAGSRLPLLAAVLPEVTLPALLRLSQLMDNRGIWHATKLAR